MTFTDYLDTADTVLALPDDGHRESFIWAKHSVSPVRYWQAIYAGLRDDTNPMRRPYLQATLRRRFGLPDPA